MSAHHHEHSFSLYNDVCVLTVERHSTTLLDVSKITTKEWVAVSLNHIWSEDVFCLFSSASLFLCCSAIVLLCLGRRNAVLSAATCHFVWGVNCSLLSFFLLSLWLCVYGGKCLPCFFFFSPPLLKFLSTEHCVPVCDLERDQCKAEKMNFPCFC